MTALADAIARLVELLAAYLAGWGKAKADTRANQAETDLAAYRERQRLEADVSKLSDDALDNELRNPPR